MLVVFPAVGTFIPQRSQDACFSAHSLKYVQMRLLFLVGLLLAITQLELK